MKISIITTCLNSDKSIAYTLSSIFEQTHKNIEHIIVDGGSSDATVKILKQHKAKKKIIIAPKTTIYEALNIGIRKSKGEYILILNSDDILNNKNVIKKAVKNIKKSKYKIMLGDVSYFDNYFFNKINRFYSAKKFEKWMFYLGLMPPHPGAFIHHSVAKKYLYNPVYKIAADYDFFLRTIKLDNIPYKTMPLTITRMRTGGVSGINLSAHIKSGGEIYKSLIHNKLFGSHFLINLRYISKIKQFFFLKKNITNFYIKPEYIKLIQYHFKLIKSVDIINFKKNFVLSALNLAFLGAYMDNKVRIYKDLVHWPDGVFIKNINILIKKIPGRKILEELKIPKEIKQITVFGNLPKESKIFLEKKFKKKITSYELPYGNIEKIIKNFNYKIGKYEFIMITLPTPKQEQLAEYLITKNKIFKILCIGGSINILSGLEKEVPKLIYPFEFIWRLRYETTRRTIRLISTFYSYLRGKYFKKKLVNLNIKIMD